MPNARTVHALVRERVVRARAGVVVVAVEVGRALVARAQRRVRTRIRIRPRAGAHVRRARVVVRAHDRRVDALAVDDRVGRARVGVVAAARDGVVLALDGMAQAILSADEATLTVGLRRSGALFVHAGVERAGVAVFTRNRVADHGGGLFLGLVGVDGLQIATSRAALRIRVGGIGGVGRRNIAASRAAHFDRSLVRHVTRRAGVKGLGSVRLIGHVRAIAGVVGIVGFRTGHTTGEREHQNREQSENGQLHGPSLHPDLREGLDFPVQTGIGCTGTLWVLSPLRFTRVIHSQIGQT